MKKNYTSIVFILLTLPFYALASQPDDSVYLEGEGNTSGLILAHGKGKHPKWLVVDPIRKGVNEKLGYHTLSLQMPTGYSNWKDYADGFPDAYRIIKDAIAFLKNEKGVTTVYLLGHSMGSRMASAFLSENPGHGLTGLIVAGCRNNGDHPLSCDQNLEKVNIPVLDIWGGDDGKDSNAAAERKSMISDIYTQVEIPSANHKFEGYEVALVEAVVAWLRKQH
jgi:pimeloyl-ACP methyl ester carboxylesterase